LQQNIIAKILITGKPSFLEKIYLFTFSPGDQKVTDKDQPMGSDLPHVGGHVGSHFRFSGSGERRELSTVLLLLIFLTF
jgi:hypothetical protein